MFSDESLESISIQSHAKSEVYVRDQLSQTKPIKEEQKSCQAVTRHHVEVQTEVDEELPAATRMRIDTSRNLTQFMLSVYPIMSEQLIANTRSHCFDGYEVDWEEDVDTEEISIMHSLRNIKNSDLKVTSLTWNSTGSVIAASLGMYEHETWCVHQSFIYVWNIVRSTVDEEKPQKVIDCDTCLLDISFHPTQPALLAGGNFAGKLFIWDLSIEDNTLVAYSGKDVMSHQEPISKVLWRNSSKLRTHGIVSVGYDGCILIWEFNQLNKELQLLNRYLLLSNSISRSVKKHGIKSDLEMGISCIDFQDNNQDLLYVGCENGGVFRCTLDASKSRKIQNHENESYLSPPRKAFHGHVAAVNSIKLSPYFEDVFLTCGSDMVVHIYSSQQVAPMVKIEPISEYLLSAQWSISRPTVFYVSTSKGKLLVMDLTLNSVAPVCVVDVQDCCCVHDVSCNALQKNIIATGDGCGVVKLWKLPSQFTQDKHSERLYFETIKDNE